MGVPKAKRKAKSPIKGQVLSQQYQRYLSKDIEDYNSQDLVFYFADAYKRAKGIPYFISMAQDSAKMKRLSSGLDNFAIIKLINWVVDNKKDINIGMLCSSWVNSFITDAGVHPLFTKYEAVIESPFLTEPEKVAAASFYDKLSTASNTGDVHGEVYWKNKLENICIEVKRRKVLLTTLEPD